MRTAAQEYAKLVERAQRLWRRRRFAAATRLEPMIDAAREAMEIEVRKANRSSAA